jgi:hypothetical protein
MTQHKNAGAGEQHVVHNWTFASESARIEAGAYVTADLYKLARQSDDNSLWMLTSFVVETGVPTWTAVGGGGAALPEQFETIYAAPETTPPGLTLDIDATCAGKTYALVPHRDPNLEYDPLNDRGIQVNLPVDGTHIGDWEDGNFVRFFSLHLPDDTEDLGESAFDRAPVHITSSDDSVNIHIPSSGAYETVEILELRLRGWTTSVQTTRLRANSYYCSIELRVYENRMGLHQIWVVTGGTGSWRYDLPLGGYGELNFDGFPPDAVAGNVPAFGAGGMLVDSGVQAGGMRKVFVRGETASYLDTTREITAEDNNTEFVCSPVPDSSVLLNLPSCYNLAEGYRVKVTNLKRCSLDFSANVEINASNNGERLYTPRQTAGGGDARNWDQTNSLESAALGSSLAVTVDWPYNAQWTFADETARLAFADLVNPSLVGYWCAVTDSGIMYQLLDDDPITWDEVNVAYRAWVVSDMTGVWRDEHNNIFRASPLFDDAAQGEIGEITVIGPKGYIASAGLTVADLLASAGGGTTVVTFGATSTPWYTIENPGSYMFVVGAQVRSVEVYFPDFGDMPDGATIEVVYAKGALDDDRQRATFFATSAPFAMPKRESAAPLFVRPETYMATGVTGSSLKATLAWSNDYAWTFATYDDFLAFTGPVTADDEGKFCRIQDIGTMYMLKVYDPLEWDTDNFGVLAWYVQNATGTWLGTDLRTYRPSADFTDLPMNAESEIACINSEGQLDTTGETIATLAETVAAGMTIPPQTVIDKFGDGHDGDVVLDDEFVTLTRDMYYNNLTLSGCLVYTSGYSVYVKETLTCNGLFSVMGAYGTDANNSVAGHAGTTLDYTGNVFAKGGIGTDGADGVAANTVGDNATPVESNYYGNGGVGGANGVALNTGNGGWGWTDEWGHRAGGVTEGTQGIVRRLWHRPLNLDFMPTSPKIGGGQGGCGGSSGGGGQTGSGALSGGGGGGGQGAGVCHIAAKTIVLPTWDGQIIYAQGGGGGKGGNAEAGSSGGGGGAGCGGGGGWVVLEFQNMYCPVGYGAQNYLYTISFNGQGGGTAGVGDNAAGNGEAGGHGGGGCLQLYDYGNGVMTYKAGEDAWSLDTWQDFVWGAGIRPELP